MKFLLFACSTFFVCLLPSFLSKVLLDKMVFLEINLNDMQPVHFCKYSVGFVLIPHPYLLLLNLGFQCTGLWNHPLGQIERQMLEERASLPLCICCRSSCEYVPFINKSSPQEDSGQRNFLLNQLQFPYRTNNLDLWMVENCGGYHISLSAVAIRKL